MAILTAILGIIPFIDKILDLFKKSPAEKERSRLANQIKQRKKRIREVNEAFSDARNGDTTKLNKLLNS